MAKSATATNNFDTELVQSLVGRIEECFTRLDSERGTYMLACKGIRSDMKDIYTEAKARGVPKKELRVFVEARQKLEAARRGLDELEADVRETVEMIAQAFGDSQDLPLFANVLERHARENGSDTATQPAAENQSAA